ncbi:phage shock protein C (PspC) family protein [Haloechinothrix alba]|uniref:Phage shock protein C (PspC) family protein n=1 Tax=Haloechinothrix alba TaxID=664784 RepID=A0A238VTD9_9PSEU|nr:PspC domain-containing protein [Haloechinothrix alba]SNR37451.1 phage shock protein C (PspC) family protein [Haloechinothrix alba]
MNAGGGTTSSAADGIEATLRDLWASRPRRPRRGRKCAGVAAAIGNRYAIDPVVVRVALAVAAFVGGAGILAYLVGWLIFPEEGDEVSPVESLLGRGRSSTSHTLTIVLCIALIPVASGTLGMGMHGGGFVGFVLLAVGLYLLHRSRGHENRPVTPTSGSGAGAHPGQATPSGSLHDPYAAGAASHSTEGSATGAARSPESWDPLGGSPFGWEFAEQDAAEPAPVTGAPRSRTRVGLITTGATLLVAGAGTALGLAGHPWFSAQHIVGLALAVVGLGLLAGSLLGGGRGLIALAAPLAVAGLVLTAIPGHDLYRGSWGNIDATPATAAQVQQLYENAAGDVTLDLTRLSGTDPVETEVRNVMGNTTVTVPEDADVRFSCSSAVGTVDCLGYHQDGFGSGTSATIESQDPDSGRLITLDLHNTLGTVEVRRG